MHGEAHGVSRRVVAQDLSAVYVEVLKPRITLMVMLMVALGFFLADGGALRPLLMLHVLVGTGLACAGSGALNQYLERDVDGRMDRTRYRPLPAKRVSPAAVLAIGVLLSVLGVAYLAATVNMVAAALNAVTVLSYVLVYTPLKRVSSLSTLVGAIPGALPPVIGWAAARSLSEPGAWALFGVLFLWQIPHFLAIGWMYREDYLRGGFPMLVVGDAAERTTGRFMIGYALALIPVSLLLTAAGVAGAFYFWTALLLGLGYLACSITCARRTEFRTARRLLLCSVLYLPLLTAALVLDRLFG